MIQNFYTGIGSRSTPAFMQDTMVEFARYLAQHDLVLRSGAADGADSAFEKGCDLEGGSKEIYIPWNGFSNRTINEPGVFIGNDEAARELASKFHPAWDRCSDGAKALHARNGHQVLGLDLRSPSVFVICWTEGGTGKGGTGQAIRIARANNIPVFDLGADDAMQQMGQFVDQLLGGA